MLNGYMIQLPVATTGNNPKLYRDPMMNEGTIYMIDPTRSDAVSFANGTVFENLAAKRAAQLIGVSESVLHPTLLVTNDPARVAVERTLKGGLNCRITAAGFASTRKIQLPIPVDIAQYMIDNIADGFHVSLHGMDTRLSTADTMFFGLATSSFSAHNAFYMKKSTAGTNVFSPAGNSAYLPSNVIEVNKPFYASGRTGAITGAVTSAANFGFQIGPFGGALAAGMPAMVLYKITIENLAISGRTAAQAAASDQALWTQNFAEGGRLFGDAWTPPMA